MFWSALLDGTIEKDEGDYSMVEAGDVTLGFGRSCRTSLRSRCLGLTLAGRSGIVGSAAGTIDDLSGGGSRSVSFG